MKKKVFIAPAWCMLILALVNLLGNLAIISVGRITSVSGNYMSVRLFFILASFAIILAAEAMIYRQIRKRIYRRDWAWLHIFFCAVAFLILPVVKMLVIYRIILTNGEGNVASEILKINRFVFYIFWGSIIAGHIFFAAVLIKGLSKRSSSPDPAGGEDGNLLDDLID